MRLPITRITKEGFTLIELLVVIAIVAILAGLVVVNLAGIRERARDTQRKSELSELKKALRLYYNDNSRYPGALSGWGSTWTVGTMTYMKTLPSDPLSPTQQYTYHQTACTNGTDDYRLVATLENASDPDIAKSIARCANDCDFVAGANSYVLCSD